MQKVCVLKKDAQAFFNCLKQKVKEQIIQLTFKIRIVGTQMHRKRSIRNISRTR